MMFKRDTVSQSKARWMQNLRDLQTVSVADIARVFDVKPRTVYQHTKAKTTASKPEAGGTQ